MGARFSLTLGALLAIGWIDEARARYIPFDPPEAKPEIVPRDIVSGNDLFCMTLALYFEGGSTGESEEGQRHIARVIHERARANRRIWGGADICDVVFYNRRGVCQFSFACLPLARRMPIRGPAWRFSRQLAEDELEGRSDLEERSIRYYMNPALTPPRNACRFRREFVKVVTAGRHQFFREATPEERRQLAEREFSECKEAARKVKPKATKKRRAAKPAAKKSQRLATGK